MSYVTWTKAADLQVWADRLEARQKLPALVRRLIHATIKNPKLVQFPADEGVQRRGWDGVLEIQEGNAWAPTGRSVWEMGTDQDPESKANGDYDKRTANPGSINIAETTFVFVTPRKWEGKHKWLAEKRADKKWAQVFVWDCDDLEQWIETAHAVDAWLARLLGKLTPGIQDLSSYWQTLSATSDPQLPASVFWAGREKATKELRCALSGSPAQISVSAIALAELRDFAAALLTGDESEESDANAAKALIIETADAWHQASLSKYPLILIPGDQLQLSHQFIAEAVKSGHHVLTQLPYTVDRSSRNIRLPRADRWEMKKALEAAGFLEERTDRITRESGGCVSILVRLASKYAGQAAPAWSKPDEASPLLPLVLLGSWSDKNEEDKRLVEQFSGIPYAQVQALAARWLNQQDSPLNFNDSVYCFASREESWQLLSPHFTKALLDRFDEIAKSVLGEDDPRFDMPAQKRYLASIHNKLPPHSHNLREGIAESVALLGTRGNHTPAGVPAGSSWRADLIVRFLLSGATSNKWYSLAQYLPLLAEAAPDEFLMALETDLQQPDPSIAVLFDKNADGFMSSSQHTSLMWALECLAWDTSHLSRVVLILASLTRLDAGCKTNPRPVGVLHDIFRFWHPQTSATTDERLQALDLLASRNPEVAYELLLHLIPSGHDMAMSGYKPRWRNYDASQIRNATRGDIFKQTIWAANRLTQLAGTDADKQAHLLNDFDKLPPDVQSNIMEWLRELPASSTIAESARTKIWKELRELVQKHRYFHDAEWVMPAATIKSLEEIEVKLQPADPVVRWSWLFDAKSHHSFGTMEMPFDEQQRMLVEAQEKAVKEVFEKYGLNGVINLANNSSAYSSQIIGGCLCKLGIVSDWKMLLPDSLTSAMNPVRNIALGYSANRLNQEGIKWIDTLPIESWSPQAVAELSLVLPVGNKTWLMLRSRMADAESIYWKRCRFYGGHLSDADLHEAVKMLMQNGRPLDAVSALNEAIHSKKQPDWSVVADALEMAATTPRDSTDSNTNTMDVWAITELFKYLQSNPATERSRMVQLEWAFLPLAKFHDFKPKTLTGELSENPRFFAEVISVLYRAKNEPQSDGDDSAKVRRWEAAYSLLDSWEGIPGTKSDGNIDSIELMSWISEARRLCTENERIEVCDLKIGEQLSYSPADSDGLWPCRAIRDVIEAIPTDHILRGFDSGVLNQRGVTSRGMNDGGEQERELVIKYRGFADKCKVAWPRTALVLRRIADQYEHEAKRHDEDAESHF